MNAFREDLDLAARELARERDRLPRFCAQLLETFEPVIARRARAIAGLAALIADADDSLSPVERALLARAGWLCDLGLIALPRAACRRGPPAGEDEATAVAWRDHPLYSQTLVARVNDDPRLGETVRWHHERFDGTGFPDGLAGERIPPAARRLAAAAWLVEAELPPARAEAALAAEAGHALDPASARVLIELGRHGTLPRAVREIEVSELRPGMVPATGVYGAHGLLLAREDRPLDLATIATIRERPSPAGPKGARLLVYL